VDINHNFDAGFDTECADMPRVPAPRRFRGECPESEPETQVLCGLCRRMSFRHVTALHTQGEEIYWKYGEHTPPQARMMAQIMASACGYTVKAPTGSAAFGGFKDWFIDTFHRPGFTIEMGRGKNPLPLSDFEEISERTMEMLLLDAML
jgi:g-D-glutamyl-meso-diaminopimelate peptidase